MVEIITKSNVSIFVDDEDFDMLNIYSWWIETVHGLKYARTERKVLPDETPTSRGIRKVFMHRMILNVSNPKIIVDHINGNPLDNRKGNLRICNIAQNARNASRRKDSTTGFKGVWRYTYDKSRFVAQICHDKKRYRLGMFDTAEDAHKAYCEKAKELFGEYARFK